MSSQNTTSVTPPKKRPTTAQTSAPTTASGPLMTVSNYVIAWSDDHHTDLMAWMAYADQILPPLFINTYRNMGYRLGCPPRLDACLRQMSRIGGVQHRTMVTAFYVLAARARKTLYVNIGPHVFFLGMHACCRILRFLHKKIAAHLGADHTCTLALLCALTKLDRPDLIDSLVPQVSGPPIVSV